MNATTETAFEISLSATLLEGGYVKVAPNSFDRQRAKDEIAYRKALKTELDSRSDDLTQLATVPRHNK